MEYKQGVENVAVDTGFPYPIKLEYDNYNIYLTPLNIPETSNVLVSKDPEDGSLINLLDANDEGKLFLVIEINDGKGVFFRSSNSRNNGQSKNNYPSRGGKFRLLNNYDFKNQKISDIIVGHRYTLLHNGSGSFRNNGGYRAAIHNKSNTFFVYIRATYRYCSSDLSVSSDLKRTGIYSNTIKLEFNI